MDAESLYQQLGRIVATAPNFHTERYLSNESQVWLGRAGALVEECCDLAEQASFRVSAEGLGGIGHASSAQTILTILHRALARAELRAPVSARGAFIAPGAPFDAFQAVGEVFRAADSDLLVVDPYVDELTLQRHCGIAHEGVRIRLLGSAKYKDCGQRLAAGLPAWVAQFGAKRPIEARRAADKKLHNRLLIVDAGREVWDIGQSLKDFARTSPTALVRLPADTAAETAAYYEEVWVESPGLALNC